MHSGGKLPVLATARIEPRKATYFAALAGWPGERHRQRRSNMPQVTLHKGFPGLAPTLPGCQIRYGSVPRSVPAHEQPLAHHRSRGALMGAEAGHRSLEVEADLHYRKRRFRHRHAKPRWQGTGHRPRDLSAQFPHASRACRLRRRTGARLLSLELAR
jgi:hypothetical protein